MTTDAPNETFGNTAADALSPAGHARDAAGEQDFRQFDGHRFKLAGEPWPLTPLTCSARCMAGARLIYPIGFEFGDLLIGQAETGQYLVVVYAEQTCRAGVDPGSPAEGR